MKRSSTHFLNKAYCAGIILLPLILYAPSAGASLKPDESRIGEVSRMIDLVYSDSFKEAYVMAEAINDTLPGRPLYNLITAGILHAEMSDLEDFSRKKEFFDRLDRAMDFLEKWSERNPGDPWGHYFAGSVHAYKSMWYAQHNSWLKTLIEGLKARGRFTRALEIDPALYDAYAGLGNYHFWSSAMLKKYLPFIDDNKSLGLRELRLAADSSYFSSRPAATGLAWALINQGQYAEAVKIGRELYDASSGGRISLWILGGANWRWGRLREAEIYYGELLESLNRLESRNYYNLIFCRYRRGVSLFLMMRHEEARKEFETLLTYDPPKGIRERHKKTYEKTREYLEKLEKKKSVKR